MAKNKRKKKLKEQDFKKVKLKVGKKLQPSQNATDTSFKSRAIFIPTQLNKDLEPTNQRNQTLKVVKLTKLEKYCKGPGKDVRTASYINYVYTLRLRLLEKGQHGYKNNA